MSAGSNIVLALGGGTVISLVGWELEKSQGGKQSAIGGAQIIFGGTVAGVLLLAISNAGQAGAEFAQGLALVTGISSALVFGGPVWSALAGAFPSKNGPGGIALANKPTTSTTSTTSTTGG